MQIPSPKVTSFQSVRFTIFLLYASILFATFCLFSACVYYYFRHEIYHNVDALLDVKAQGLESSIRTYLKAKDIEAPSGWAAFISKFQPKPDGFSIIADFLTQGESNLPAKQIPMDVNIFDSHGKLIASTYSTPVIQRIDSNIMKDVLSGRKNTHNFQMLDLNKKRVWTRAITKPIRENKDVLYIIQVRVPLKPMEMELAKIRRMLILLVLVTLLITSWAGVVLVNVTLSPVDKMVRKIRNIRSDNLNVRLSPPQTNDEIKRLAITFNEMLDRLQRSFASQNQIIQDLSHELKTPLTILRGQFEVALKRQRSEEEYKEIMRGSLSEIEKMRVIIDDLLMMARLDSRTMILEMKNTELTALLQSVLQDAGILAQAKKIDIRFESAQAVMIQGNEVHLQRLFMNLLGNAVKYTPVNGRIKVALHSKNEDVRVTIEDNGIGIKPDALPHIFDRFYRVENSRRGEGHGLGLSIVKSIIEAHKASIEVESKPGLGTKFTIGFSKHSPMMLFSQAEK